MPFTELPPEHLGNVVKGVLLANFGGTAARATPLSGFSTMFGTVPGTPLANDYVNTIVVANASQAGNTAVSPRCIATAACPTRRPIVTNTRSRIAPTMSTGM